MGQVTKKRADEILNEVIKEFLQTHRKQLLAETERRVKLQEWQGLPEERGSADV